MKRNNAAVTTNPFILTFLQHFECNCTHIQAIIFSVNSRKVQVYHGKNTVTKNNKIQFKNLVLALRMTIKLCQCGKGVKTKIKKIFGVSPSFIGF